MTDTTLIAIGLPVMVSALLYISKNKIEEYASWIATLVTGISLISLIMNYSKILNGHSATTSYSWVPSLGLTFSLYVDTTSFFLGVI
ncbi:hypothetical protein FJY84_08955, partial [Candidatus Bathyarchaeota archaeon]|nr:hypothetical protein [Candidatus Bathyarchaeota archaeon]